VWNQSANPWTSPESTEEGAILRSIHVRDHRCHALLQRCFPSTASIIVVENCAPFPSILPDSTALSFLCRQMWRWCTNCFRMRWLKLGDTTLELLYVPAQSSYLVILIIGMYEDTSPLTAFQGVLITTQHIISQFYGSIMLLPLLLLLSDWGS
jgi:hypothetical protein